MNATEFAAWWGAIIASFTLVWNIYRWHRTECRIRVRILPNMSVTRPSGKLSTTKTVIVEAINVGGKNTTITHLVGLRYSSLAWRLFRRSPKYFAVPDPLLSPGFPYLLKPGETWSGGIEQSAEIEKMSRDELLYCGVYHALSKKPVLARVVIKPQSS